MRVIGYYATPDDAYCLDHFDPDTWEGFEGWAEPVAIFSDTEADAPTHCAEPSCKALIPHRLTPDGVAYISERMTENDLGRPSILREWFDWYRDLLDDKTRERAYRLTHKVYTDPGTGHYITWNGSERFNVYDRTDTEVNTFGHNMHTDQSGVLPWVVAERTAREWWAEYGREDTEQLTFAELGFPIHGPGGLYG